MVMIASYHAGGPEFNFRWQPIFNSRFLRNLCSEAVGASRFVVLVEDSDTGGLSSNTVSMA